MKNNFCNLIKISGFHSHPFLNPCTYISTFYLLSVSESESERFKIKRPVTAVTIKSKLSGKFMITI